MYKRQEEYRLARGLGLCEAGIEVVVAVQAVRAILGQDPAIAHGRGEACLLYTSYAADQRSRGDLGGGRIIKKKKKKRRKVASHT